MSEPKVGRPTKYTEDLIERSRAYVESEPGSFVAGEVVHTIAGLASVIGVRRETVHAWARDPDKEEFSHIVESLMTKQELITLNKGLSGELNANMAKLALTKHGYADRVDTQNDTRISLGDLSDDELRDIVANG